MLVDVKVGKAWEFIKNSTITTEAINKEAKSRKQIRTQLILMFLNQREMFRQLEEVGIIVNPIPPHISIETQEDFEKQKEFTLKEFGFPTEFTIIILMIKLNHNFLKIILINC
jgi:hypothetical protein